MVEKFCAIALTIEVAKFCAFNPAFKWLVGLFRLAKLMGRAF